MKKSIILGLALVSFMNVAMANETATFKTIAASEVKLVGGTPLCTAISKGELGFR